MDRGLWAALLRGLLRLALSLGVWAGGMALFLATVAAAGLGDVLEAIAGPSAQAVAQSFADVAAALRAGDAPKLLSSNSAWVGGLLRQPEMFLLVVTFPSVVAIDRVFAKHAVASFTQGPPPFLKVRNTFRWQGRRALTKARVAPDSALARALPTLRLFADQQPAGPLLFGVYGPSRTSRLELAAAWVAELRAVGWHAGTADRIPDDWEPRRRTAMVVNLDDIGAHAFRRLVLWLDELRETNPRAPVRVLVLCGENLGRLCRLNELSLFDHVQTHLFMESDQSARPVERRWLDRAQVKKEKKPEGRGEDPTSTQPQASAPVVSPAANFLFYDEGADGAERQTLARNVVTEAIEVLGADGWRLLMAEILVGPTPPSLRIALLPGTGHSDRLHTVLVSLSEALGVELRGVDPDDWREREARTSALNGMIIDAILERIEPTDTESFVVSLFERARDRAARGVLSLPRSSNLLDAPPELLSFYPPEALVELEERAKTDRQVELFRRSILRPAQRYMATPAFLAWRNRLFALAPAALMRTPVERRGDMLRLLAAWQNQHGPMAEYELFARSSTWLADDGALYAVVSALTDHLVRHLPPDLAETIPTFRVRAGLWADMAHADSPHRPALAALDTLDTGFEAFPGPLDDEFLARWPIEDERLRTLLGSGDPMDELMASWAYFWLFGARHDAPPIVPVSDDTVAALARFVARPDAPTAAWRRAADALGKVCAPVIPGDPIYEWAVFADTGKDTPRVRPLERTVRSDRIAGALAEAKRRLLSRSSYSVRTAAAQLVALYEPDSLEAVEALADAIRQPDIRRGERDYFTVRLAETDSANGRAALSRLMIEGGDDAQAMGFLGLLGLRAFEETVAALPQVHDADDRGLLEPVHRWSRALGLRPETVFTSRPRSPSPAGTENPARRRAT